MTIRYPKGDYILLLGPERVIDDNGKNVLKSTLFKNENPDNFDVQHYAFFRMGMNGSESVEEWRWDPEDVYTDEYWGLNE